MNVTLYPVRPHRCDIGGPDADDVYVGVTRQCEECHTWYVAKQDEFGRYWTKVRWHHLKAKALIHEYHAKSKEIV